MTRIRVLAVVATLLVTAGAITVANAADAPTTFAFVARGDDGADALGASSLAGRLNSPIILVGKTTLPTASTAALVSADPDVIFILGGVGAISAEVEADIAKAVPGAEVERLAGKTRYETAQLVAAKFPELAAAFLGAGDKAVSALVADEALKFGGLAADEYSSVTSTTDYSDAIGDGDPETFPANALIEVFSIEVDVPADGMLLTGAHATLADPSEDMGVTAFLSLDTSLAELLEDDDQEAFINGSVALSAYNFQTHKDEDTADEVNHQQQMDLIGAVPVTAGTHSLHVVLNGGPEGSTLLVLARRLWAQFIPNGSYDFTPLVVPTPAPGRPMLGGGS